MRNPGLILVAIVLNWFALALLLLTLVAYSREIQGSHTSLVVTAAIFLLVAVLQTVFLFRNMRVSFDVANSTEKSKQRPDTRLSKMVDALDDDERTELLELIESKRELYR